MRPTSTSYVTIITHFVVKSTIKLASLVRKKSLCRLHSNYAQVQFFGNADRYVYFLPPQLLSSPTFKHKCCQTSFGMLTRRRSFHPADEILIDYQPLMVRLLSEPSEYRLYIWHPTVTTPVWWGKPQNKTSAFRVKFHCDIITFSWFHAILVWEKHFCNRWPDCNFFE